MVSNIKKKNMNKPIYSIERQFTTNNNNKIALVKRCFF